MLGGLQGHKQCHHSGADRQHVGNARASKNPGQRVGWHVVASKIKPDRSLHSKRMAWFMPRKQL
jgi:hypothetical protein